MTAERLLRDYERSPALAQSDKLSVNGGPKDYKLAEFSKQLLDMMASNPAFRFTPNTKDPKLAPMVWVSKWVDYSDEAFGCAFSDDNVGLVFIDLTKLVLRSDGMSMHYLDLNGFEHHYTLLEFPRILEKKVKRLTDFMDYQKKHLPKAGADIQIRKGEGDQLSLIPSLKTWFRAPRAVVMHLTNGTLQIDFKDNTKLICNPLVGAVTYIDKQKKAKTFNLELIKKFGCTADLSSKLTYAEKMVQSVMKSSKITSPPSQNL